MQQQYYFVKNTENMGFVIPNVKPMAKHFRPYQFDETNLHIPRQFPMRDGKLVYKGKVGDLHSAFAAEDALRLCFLNIVENARHCAFNHGVSIIRVKKLDLFLNTTLEKIDPDQILIISQDFWTNVFSCDLPIDIHIHELSPEDNPVEALVAAAADLTLD